MQQLRYLVAVADTLSFSRAAQACHVTQPTLSMQLKELESRLAVQLVERTRSRVMLTSVGAEVATRARRVLAEVDDIREVVRHDDPAVLQGIVQTGVIQTVGAYVLSVAMPALRAEFPDMRIFLREDRIENLPHKLADGTHDVLLLADDPAHPHFTSMRLIEEPLHLVLPVDHHLAASETVDPAALAGETILLMENGHRLHSEIAALCEEHGAIAAQDFAGTTLDTLRLMVTTGMGLSLLPALYVRSDVLREKLIVARPLSRQAPIRDLRLVWRGSSPRSEAYERLGATIRESLRPWDRESQMSFNRY